MNFSPAQKAANSATTQELTSILLNPKVYQHVKFEVFTAVTMKNAVFWAIKTQFAFQRKHITSLL
jgi:hypothetical protein